MPPLLLVASLGCMDRSADCAWWLPLRDSEKEFAWSSEVGSKSKGMSAELHKVEIEPARELEEKRASVK